MAHVETKKLESWLAAWPVGSRGRFGGRVKENVTVVAVLWERNLPTLKLLADTRNTYYCKYGMRQYLEAE